jgi:hypothetical protein
MDKVQKIIQIAIHHYQNPIESKPEGLMVVKFQVEVFWVVTLCSVVVGYQCFRGPCYLHLLGVGPLKCILPQHYKASQPRR